MGGPLPVRPSLDRSASAATSSKQGCDRCARHPGRRTRSASGASFRCRSPLSQSESGGELSIITSHLAEWKLFIHLVLHDDKERTGLRAGPFTNNSIPARSGFASQTPTRSPIRAYYWMIFATTPAPTVRPPSRIAKRRPSSIAIGAISVTTILMLSPGMTISTPSGNSTAPVMSVVRK